MNEEIKGENARDAEDAEILLCEKLVLKRVVRLNPKKTVVDNALSARLLFSR